MLKDFSIITEKNSLSVIIKAEATNKYGKCYRIRALISNNLQSECFSTFQKVYVIICYYFLSPLPKCLLVVMPGQLMEVSEQENWELEWHVSSLFKNKYFVKQLSSSVQSLSQV